MRERNIIISKGRIKTLKVTSHGTLIEMVKHKTLTARCSTLHLLLSLANHKASVFVSVFIIVKRNLRCRIINRYGRSAKRPACTCSHICLYAKFCTFILHIFEHAHPARRQVTDFIGIITLHAIDRSNLDTAYSYFGKFGEIILKTCRIHSTAQPPPASVWLCLLCYWYPLLSH